MAIPVLVLAVACGAAQPAEALGPNGTRHRIGAATSDSAIDVNGVADTERLASRPAASSKGKSPTRLRRLVPACEGNQLTLTAPADVMCPEALSLCARTPAPDDLMFWVYVGPLGVVQPAGEQWTHTGSQCLKRDEVPNGAAPAIPEFTLADFRRLPLPAGRANIEPPSLRTLVNIPTNLFVNAAPLTLETDLVGFPVQVRATPARFMWRLGDGSVLKTADAGGPYPDMTTTHTYRQKGAVSVQLTTIYAGEYSIAGGPWTPIDGEAAVQSPAVALTVLEARSHLVDDLDS
jgi:hypothetical protein